MNGEMSKQALNKSQKMKWT